MRILVCRNVAREKKGSLVFKMLSLIVFAVVLLLLLLLLLLLGLGIKTKSLNVSAVASVPTSRCDLRTTWYTEAFFLSMNGFFLPMMDDGDGE